MRAILVFGSFKWFNYPVEDNTIEEYIRVPFPIGHIEMPADSADIDISPLKCLVFRYRCRLDCDLLQYDYYGTEQL